MIYRAVKDKDNRYVRLNVGAANDERLSYKAVGIHTYIMTKPDGWEANETDIARRHCDGLASVRSGVKELIQHGYMVRIRIIDAQKRVKGWRIDTFETPELNPHYIPGEPFPAHVDEPDCENLNLATEPDCEKPHVENPQMEKPHVENRNHSNKRVLVKIDSSNNRREDEPATQVSPQQELFGAVCEAVGWDYRTLTKEDQGQVAQTCGILSKAGYAAGDVTTFMQTVWFRDWRWQKNQALPTIKQLRQEIGKIRSTVPAAAPASVGKNLQGVADYINRQRSAS